MNQGSSQNNKKGEVVVVFIYDNIKRKKSTIREPSRLIVVIV